MGGHPERSEGSRKEALRPFGLRATKKKGLSVTEKWDPSQTLRYAQGFGSGASKKGAFTYTQGDRVGGHPEGRKARRISEEALRCSFGLSLSVLRLRVM